MTPDRALQTIMAALPGVDASQISFNSDGSAVTVRLHDKKLKDFLRENGRYVREAAMATDIRIDVELGKED